jgi:two-component system, LuxR family, sensor kinase FixL
MELPATLNAGQPLLRKTGLSAVGEVPWGTHFCMLYDTRAELLETVAPYLAQGLAGNEFCLWITSLSLGAVEAEAALRATIPDLGEYLASGQIEIVDFDDWYGDRFQPDQALKKIAGKLVAALERGFDGMRVTSSTFSLARDDWDAFVRYEAAIDRIVGSKRILALCPYSLEKWSMSEIFDVIATHDFALAKEGAGWKASKSFSRQRIEEGLLESEARLRATISGVGDGIITTDDSGTILSINPAATRMFGYSPYDLVGENVGILFAQQGCFFAPGDRRQDVGRDIGGKILETRGCRKDGAVFPLECTISETADRGQSLCVIVLRDLTERVETEARMQKLRADRLEAMGGMAAALSHEINQPLAAIAAYLSAAQRLLGRSLFKPSGLQDALGKAAAQVTRAGRIISGMKAFAIHGEPDATPQGMYELAREAYESISIAGLSGVEASFHANSGDDRVLADKIQIQQVLINLIRNALESMREAPKRTLTVSISATDKGMVRTDVRDSGAGLPAHIKETLFEPFKTTKATGMGVGLSISRSIIEAHHGRLWAEENPEGGTIFSFTLPSANCEPV